MINDLVYQNKQGVQITNSDFELEVEVLEIRVIIAMSPSIKGNPMVHYNMASKSNLRIFGQMIQELAIKIHTNHMGPIFTMHMSGDDNMM